MTILVLGATGFIGAPLTRALISKGEAVVAASRRGGGPAGVALDRADAAAVAALVGSRGVCTVVDLIAYTEADTLPLVAALAGRVERYVLASSMDVYRNYDGLHRKAAPQPIVGAMDEASPLRERLYPYRTSPRRLANSPDAWQDDYDKIPLEAAVRRTFPRHAILRLPMVYGRGDRQRRFAWALTPMIKGRDNLLVDPDWAVWRTTYGFVDDVADALATCAARFDGPAGTFNLGEASPPDHREWVARFVRATGWGGRVELAPAPPGNPIAALNLRYPLIADTRAFRKVYGWREPTALTMRVARTVAEHNAHLSALQG